MSLGDPGIKIDPGYSVYTEGLAGEHFLETAEGVPFVGNVWPGDAAFPDFTRADTRRWWGDLAGALSASGIRGIWLDVNEPTTFPESGGATSLVTREERMA